MTEYKETAPMVCYNSLCGVAQKLSLSQQGDIALLARTMACIIGSRVNGGRREATPARQHGSAVISYGDSVRRSSGADLVRLKVPALCRQGSSFAKSILTWMLSFAAPKLSRAVVMGSASITCQMAIVL